MNDKAVASNWLQLLGQAVRLAGQTSKAYRLALLASVLIYVVLYYLLILLMLDKPTVQSMWLALAHSLIDGLSFFAACHLLIRPYLKLVLLPQGRYGSNLLGFIVFSLLVGQIMMLSGYWLSECLPKDALNIRQMSFGTSEQQVQLNMSEPTLLLMGGINLAVTSWIWSLAYVLWHSQAARRQMQQQMHQAQLQQLTNQLNPHFLFNALNSIRALIFEDQHKAADAVTRLSELFRVHLQAHLRPLSSLAEEWQLASHYLQIEQIRFEQRLQVHTEFADSLWQQQLPTLSLLTLIENAVKHGIAQCPQGGHITIRSMPTSYGWQLQICNTCPPRPQSTPGTGTGLANTRHRLQLMSGRNRLQSTRQRDQFCLSMELYHELENPDS